MDCVSNDAEVGARARLRAERDIFFHSHCRPASVLAFCQRGAGEPLVILSITRRGRAVWCQRRRSPARKARSAHSSGSSRNFAAQSPGCALSRVFSHARRLAQPPCNSRASARFDFPSARRSISRRASDSGRFSSLQIGTALQCASIEPRSADQDNGAGASTAGPSQREGQDRPFATLMDFEKQYRATQATKQRAIQAVLEGANKQILSSALSRGNVFASRGPVFWSVISTSHAP